MALACAVTIAALPSSAGARAEEPPAESVEARDRRWAEEAGKVEGLWSKGDLAAALKLARGLLAEQEKVLGPDDAAVGETLVDVAGLCGDTGDPVAAKAGFERALRILEATRGKDSMDVAEALLDFGWFLRERKEHPVAEPLLRRALTIAEASAGPDATVTLRVVGFLGLVLSEQGNLREARPLLARDLAATEKKHGADSLATATALNNLAYLQWRAEEHAEARVLFERALAIRDARLGPAAPVTIATVFNLGQACAGEGRIDEAVKAFERVVSSAKTLGAKGEEQGLEALDALASLLHERGRMDSARAAYERLLAERLRVLGPDAQPTWTARLYLGQVLMEMGRLSEAEPHIQRVVDDTTKRYGAEHPAAAGARTRLGVLRVRQGRLEEAVVIFEEVLAAHVRAEGEHSPAAAEALVNLAATLSRAGRGERALEVHHRAVAAARAVHGVDHPATWHAESSLASALLRQGRPEAARVLLQRVHERCAARLGPAHPQTVGVLGNLGQVLIALGQAEAARPLLEQVLAQDERRHGASSPNLIVPLSNLALLLYDLGESEESIRLLERALAIAVATPGLDPLQIALLRDNLAGVLGRLGRFAEARRHSEEALRAYQERYGPEHPDTGLALKIAADLALKAGDLPRGLELYEQAAAVHEKQLPATMNTARILDGLAQARSSAGRQEAGLEASVRALECLQASVRQRFAGLSSPERVVLAQECRSLLANHLRRFDPTQGGGYDAVLRMKGIAFRAELAERAWLRGLGADPAGSREALLAAEGRLARLANSVPPRAMKDAAAAWREAYAKAAAERERLALASRAASPALREGFERLDLGLKEVQSALPPRSALVDVLRVGTTYVAWVIGREGPVKAFGLEDAQSLEAALADFGTLGGRATDPASEPVVAAGAKLHAKLVRPLLAAAGADVERLFVCPDGALASLPWAALPGPDGKGYLGDAVRIALLPVAQDMVPSKQPGPQGTGALLVGGVDYEHAQAQQSPPSSPPMTAPAAGDRARGGSQWGPLQGAKLEVEALLAPAGAKSQVLLGAEATEAAVRSQSSGRRWLHFATHGFVREDLLRGLDAGPASLQGNSERARHWAAGHDPMALAGLALAGANTRDGANGDDGILTAGEASYLDLGGVDLVVLSACETSLGHAAAGEGVLGLVQGFRLAGARQIVGSLWKVDDAATRALMERFHAARSGAAGTPPQSVSPALATAQAHVRSQSRWAHPHFWAAWVVWGRDAGE